MDIQTALVAIIIFIAFIYVGKMMFAKMKSFSSESNCGSDCGCDSNSNKKFVEITRK